LRNHPYTRRIQVSCEVTFDETKVGIPGPYSRNFIALDLDKLIPDASLFTTLLTIIKNVKFTPNVPLLTSSAIFAKTKL